MQLTDWKFFFNPLKKNPVFIAGFSARTGFANAKLLLKNGVRVVLLEENFNRSRQSLFSQLRQAPTTKRRNSSNAFSIGSASPMVYTHLSAATLAAKSLGTKHLIISPGMPRSHSAIETMQAAGTKIWSDFDFFYPLFQHKTIVALSGTNGKTTTALLITHLLNSAIDQNPKSLKNLSKNNTSSVNKALPVNNVGVPIAALLHSAENNETHVTEFSEAHPLAFKTAQVLVFELSSYMLEKTMRFKADVSLLTNLAADHLDRYKNRNAYFRTKTNIVKATHPDGTFIFNGSCPHISSFQPLLKKLSASKLDVILVQNKTSSKGATKKLNTKQSELTTTLVKNNINLNTRSSITYENTKKREPSNLNDYHQAITQKKPHDFHSTKTFNKKLLSNNKALSKYFLLKTNTGNTTQVENKVEESITFLPVENTLLSLATIVAIKNIGDEKTHSSNKSYTEKKTTDVPSISLEKAVDSLKNFKTPAHRMQRVFPLLSKNSKKLKESKVLAKSLVINDSKATTPESVEMALSFFADPEANAQTRAVILIVGGKNKGLSFTPLAKRVASLHAVVCYGDAITELKTQFTNFSRNSINDGYQAIENKLYFQEEFVAAFKKSSSLCEEALANGRPFVLLLSPGCASFDQFSNFEKRGDLFVKLTQSWLSGLN